MAEVQRTQPLPAAHGQYLSPAGARGIHPSAAGSAGDGRQEVQVTAMVPIQLPVLGNLACRLLVKVLIRVAGVKEFSVPVPVPRRSACAAMPKAEVENEILIPIAVVTR